MKDDMKNLPKGLIEASREAMKGATERSIVERQDLDEKLHGDQYKLDLNRNGKLDKHDFKLARKKKQVDEILGRGANKASLVEVFAPGINDLHEAIGEMVRFDRLKKVATVVIEGKTYKIKQSQYKAVTEAMLDELSSATLSSYAKKAQSNSADQARLGKSLSNISKSYSDKRDQEGASHYNNLSNKAYSKSDSRKAGAVKALGKISEEVEQIDEVSTKTLSSYASKIDKKIKDNQKTADAYGNVADTLADQGKDHGHPDFEDAHGKAIEHDTIASNKRAFKNLANAKIKEKEAKQLRTLARGANYTGIKIREETEQLDEVSKDTLKSYQSKAEAEVKGSIKRGKPGKAALALRAKRGKGLENAKAKLQAIVKKESEAHYNEAKKANADVDKHFEDNHHAAMTKHGFSLVNQGTHGDKNVKTYIHHHDNGHSTMVGIHTKHDDDGMFGYKHEVRAMNSKGTSWSAHYPNRGAWSAKETMKHKTEMMPKFESHIIDVKDHGAREGNW